jgi:hypothetical protein
MTTGVVPITNPSYLFYLFFVYLTTLLCVKLCSLVRCDGHWILNWKVWKKAAAAYTELLSGDFLTGRRKASTDIGTESRSSGRDLNPGLAKYKAGIFLSPPRGSVPQGLYSVEGNCSLTRRSLWEPCETYSLLSDAFFTDLSVGEQGAEERGRTNPGLEAFCETSSCKSQKEIGIQY